MNLKFSHKILLAASGVVVLAFALFTLYNDYLQRNTINQNIESSVQQAGNLTASSVQNWLSGRILVLEGLAQNVAYQGSQADLPGLVDQPVFTSNFQFTYVGQANGVFTQRPDAKMPEGYDPRERPWYKQAVSAGKTMLTPPYMAAVGGLIVTIAMPVKKDGQLLGVVGGDLSLDSLVKIINSVDSGGLGYAFLVSGDGQVIVSPDKDQVMKNLKDIYPSSALKIQKGIQEVQLNGQERIISFTPVTGLPSADWYIGQSLDKEKAYAPLSKFRTSALIAMFIAVAAIALLLSLLIQVLMRPLTTMGRAMQDIAQSEGDLTRRLEYAKQDAATKAKIDAKIAGYKSPVDFYVDRLAEGIATITASVAPNPVIVRLSDFKSNEYANLIGGARYEPHEENPMIGFRGASRYIDPSFSEAFALECRAVKRVREEMGLDNLWVMIPFVRTLDEGRKVIDVLAKNGLKQGDNGLKVIMMCEVPSNALLADDFLDIFDGFSIGSNDMTQLTLGLDRDSSIVANLFDERDPAVKKMLSMAISAAKRKQKYVGICGQGPSDHPDLAQWLMDEGIESVSLNPDTVVDTWLKLAKSKAG